MTLATLSHLLVTAALEWGEERQQRPVIALQTIRGSFTPDDPIELLAVTITIAGEPAEAIMLFDDRLSAADRHSMTEAAGVRPTRELYVPPRGEQQ